MLTTAMIFGSGMVLQRAKPIPVWGKAEPDSLVSVTLGESRTTVVTGADGSWKAVLPARTTEEQLHMYITDGKKTIHFEDICVGEVWVAGGQSNMEFPLDYDAEASWQLGSEIRSEIRFFTCPQISYEEQLSEYDYSQYGFWRKASREAARYFSAVGYYFAHDIWRELKVPVGIVGCNWGGTPACSWLEPELLANTEGRVWLEDYERESQQLDLEEYRRAFRADVRNNRAGIMDDEIYIRMIKQENTEEAQKSFQQCGEQPGAGAPPLGPYSELRPGGLYETMLKKIVPYGVRGILWYQGESDERHAGVYGTVFRKLIESWRKLWGEELPFLFVQLAPFEAWMAETGVRYPILRQQQELMSKTIPGTWMISSSDSGSRWDIHPKKKRKIGERLALAARGHVYGERILCDAPELVDAIAVGDKVVLEFASADGLHVKGEEIAELEVRSLRGEAIPVKKYEIKRNLLILYDCPGAMKVSMAHKPYYCVNLYNKAELPAKPFERIIFCTE